MNGHKEDILSITVSPPNLLATSSYDGEVSLNAGTELRSFIAGKGACAGEWYLDYDVVTKAYAKRRTFHETNQTLIWVDLN